MTLDFANQWDAARAAAKATPLGQRMVAAGYDIARTGEDTLAWNKTLQYGYWVWIDYAGGLGLAPGLEAREGDTRWVAILFTDQGDELDATRGTLDHVMAWAANHAQPAEVANG